MAVSAAVSAAITIFSAISIILFFSFIIIRESTPQPLPNGRGVFVGQGLRFICELEVPLPFRRG